jgi:hypothetical protein
MSKQNENARGDSDSSGDGEIDTFFAPSFASEGVDAPFAENFAEFATRITAWTETKGKVTKAPEAGVLSGSRSLVFEDFKRAVYCSLTNPTLTLAQSTPLSGTSILTFTQRCGSSRSDRKWVGPWTFTVALFDAGGARITSLGLGEYSHRCGLHTPSLYRNWSVSNNEYNPIERVASATLTWNFYQRVHGC